MNSPNLKAVMMQVIMMILLAVMRVALILVGTTKVMKVGLILFVADCLPLIIDR